MYSCPKCGSKDLLVEVTAVAKLVQGTKPGDMLEDVASDFSWNGDSRMMCNDCEHDDLAKRFSCDEPNPFGARNTDEALRCARAVLCAYARGEMSGGEMEWDDVDQVFELAKRALPMEYEAILAQMQVEHGTIES